MRLSGQCLLFVALTAAAIPQSAAFVPSRTLLVTQPKNTEPSTTRINAGRLPPPPPPPPESNDLFAGLLKSLQDGASSTTNNLEVPKVQVPSIDLPHLPDLPNLDLQALLAPVGQLLDSSSDQLASAQQFLQENLQPFLSDNYPQLLPAYQTFWNTLQQLSLDSPYAPAAAIVVSTLLIQSLVDPFRGMGPQQPYPQGRYDPDTAKTYFDRRPAMVAARGLQVVTQSLSFAASFLSDYMQEQQQQGNPISPEQAEQRGQELATLLVRLGSTYIKVGQSLSIRTDLLSPPYIRGLQTLQDRVPPFDSDKAFEMIEEEWGRPLDQIVSDITPVPVASASLGQVYKATLKDTGIEVAIKVQRPDIMEQIALDMYVLREYIAPTAKTVGKLNSDTVGTVDAWGLGFVDELNYIQEAQNAQFFTEQIAKTPLKDVVFSPTVVEEYSTARVLVTEWVDGERLDKSSKEDVTTLCSIAMNTYLTMLLEIGMLHCDPHPGNLLRTPDGRLAILDWGMITQLDGDMQLTLIEHMAHLTSADYEEIPRDLLLLGFIPENKKHLINDSGVVELLAEIYSTWTAGGGAAAFNVNDVINKLQDLTAKKGNLFQIPPYFAYIAKSFSVLEGIGLSNDPKYSIINDCLPYVSQRLLTDSESMQSALNTFIFGPDKNSEYRIVDYDRVEQLVTGFGEYTTSASGALLGKEDLSRTQVLESATDQLLDLIFTEEETPLQAIMLEQLAKITASTSRSLWTEMRERSGTLPSGRTVLGTLIDPIGLWRTSPLVRMNELDEKTVETTRKLFVLVQEQAQSTSHLDLDLTTLTPEEVVEVSSMLVRKVWDKRMGVVQTGGRFARQLLELTAMKLERGERDTRKLPAAADDNESSNGTEDESEPTPLLAPERTTPPVMLARNRASATPSPRLQEARQLLNRLQNED
ncbi:OF BC1 COMPLEX KINASE 3, chloroplastic [Seminavis robusta]|uniref:OF BC1 COMPLEX KINASE 3, chloroplastic n=1 Tax=Seminavis robusta TaxID=568900 RepID=A0A9N8E8E2_9STRA|nr:OF BC1 COMPLEX KINASE 3, chloroplastic [Seminavis robusta]|eukprot:Sro796_g203790.1 OF BC1 COMPLEX KINASE 3, chloroplastic (924) ;mRNA; f:33262-36033